MCIVAGIRASPQLPQWCWSASLASLNISHPSPWIRACPVWLRIHRLIVVFYWCYFSSLNCLAENRKMEGLRAALASKNWGKENISTFSMTLIIKLSHPFSRRPSVCLVFLFLMVYLQKSLLSFTDPSQLQLQLKFPNSITACMGNASIFFWGIVSALSPFISFLFCVWTQPGVHCSAKLAFCCTCLISYTWGEPFLCFEEVFYSNDPYSSENENLNFWKSHSKRTSYRVGVSLHYHYSTLRVTSYSHLKAKVGKKNQTQNTRYS